MKRGKRMKVSIVVPCYNVMDYVERCIDSIVNQTYENIEIILVNDGSTDDTLKILEKYESLENIKIIDQLNGGLSKARNVGIENSLGDAIFFVDSDDWINLETINNLVENMSMNDSDISVCGITYHTSKAKRDVGVNKEILLTGPEAVEAYYYKKNNMEPMVWNKLYKRELFEDLRFEEGKIHEDKYFTPKVLYKSKNVSFIPYSGYNYFDDRADSITNLRMSERNLTGLGANISNYEYFNQKNDIKLATLAKSKYYEDLAFYYCLFKTDGRDDLASQMYKKLNNGLIEYVLVDLRLLKISTLFKKLYLNIFPKHYYSSWRKKQND